MGLFGPSFDDVWSSNDTSPGTVVGIRWFRRHAEDHTVDHREYAVELDDGSVLGIRQWLEPLDEVRLGMPVTVARRKKAAVIRWGDPSDGWKMVAPPAPGITDEVTMKGVAGWTPVELEIVGFGARAGMLGLTAVAQAEVRVHADGLVAIGAVDRWTVPFYASHLGAVGSRVPGLRDPRDIGSVRVDWPAAVAAEPGIGVAARERDVVGDASISMMGAGADAPSVGLPGMFDAFQRSMTEKVMAAVGADASASAAADDPVPWETYLAAAVAMKNEPTVPPDDVAQRFGLEPGEWHAAHQRWLGRMMTDWKLGAAYGEAMS